MDYERAFAELGQTLIDLDGDGIPDVAVPTRDPMRAINQRFDPMTPQSRAGMPPAEIRASAGPPTTLDRARNALLDYGPIPAKIATGIAMQPVRAGEAVGEALSDPTLANVTNAGVQTGMALGSPLLTLGSLGLGYLEAGRRDAGLSFVNSAQAQSKGKQQQSFDNGYTRDQLQAVADQTGMTVEMLGTMTRGRVQKLMSETAGAAAGKRVEAQAEKERARQEEYNRAVQRAEASRDKALARETRFTDTDAGKIYEKTGGAAPFLAGFAGGALSRTATGGKGGLGNDYGLPALMGAAGGIGAANIPLLYDAYATEKVNPEREAYLAYDRDLPEGHPMKGKARAYAESLPEANPIRSAASDELIGKMVPRSLAAGLEGALAGVAGSDLVRAAPRALDAATSIPGRVANGVVAGFRTPVGPPPKQPPKTPPNPPPSNPSPFDGSGLLPVGSTGRRSYPLEGTPARDYIRNDYADAVMTTGKPLDAATVNRTLQQEVGNAGFQIPNVQKRTELINQAISDFSTRTGRMPTRAELMALFNKQTLAVPAAIGVGAGANALMQSGVAEDRRNALMDY